MRDLCRNTAGKSFASGSKLIISPSHDEEIDTIDDFFLR